MATLPEKDLRLAYHVGCTVGAIYSKNGSNYIYPDIGNIIARAKSGGEGGYAFNIVENGYSETDGIMIRGAEPYWNIYSKNSPGQWFVYGASSELRVRIKRESTASNSKYRFSIGDFRGYNHAAIKPYLFPEGSTIYVPQNQVSIVVGITIFWDFGEVDWKAAIGNYTHIHIMAGKELYYAYPVIDEYISIEDYDVLGHYTVETTQGALGGIPDGGKLYFWGEFSMGEGNKICDFPTTSYGIIHWGEYWAKNVLGNITTVIQSTPDYVTATNYTVTSKEMTDADTTTQNVRFNLTKTGNDSREIDSSRSYIRCKWRDQSNWQDCPAYKIELPPEVNLTRTQYCTLPVRPGIDQEFIIDIQLVLVYK